MYIHGDIRKGNAFSNWYSPETIEDTIFFYSVMNYIKGIKSMPVQESLKSMQQNCMQK